MKSRAKKLEAAYEKYMKVVPGTPEAKRIGEELIRILFERDPEAEDEAVGKIVDRMFPT